MEVENRRALKFKTLDGQIYDLNVESSITIDQLKAKLEPVVKVPKDKIRLVYLGKLMKDQDSLNQYINEDGHTVHLMAKTLNTD